MKITITQLNIVQVYQEQVQSLAINKNDILDFLGEQLSEEQEIPDPTLLDMPNGPTLFDYSSNTDFPLQLSLIEKMQIMSLNGNVKVDLNDDSTLKKFVELFVKINKTPAFEEKREVREAIGMNISATVVSGEKDKPFGKVEPLDTLFPQYGDLVARGVQVVRKTKLKRSSEVSDKRVEIKILPNIPKMGEDFTDSYEVKANFHIEPADSLAFTPGAILKEYKKNKESLIKAIEEQNG